MTVTKGEKNRAEQDIIFLKREIENLERELRSKDTETHKLNSQEETSKRLLGQTNERMLELKEENYTLKQDKEKLFSKLDHLLYENDNLRNEIFMMKKIMLEVEKRDVQVGSLVYDNIRREEKVPRREEKGYSRGEGRDHDLEAIRTRPERRR